MAAVRGHFSVSLAAGLADLVGLRSKQQVEVRRLDSAEEAESLFGLAHVELSFRDQYVSRAGMWRFRNSFIHSSVFNGQNLTADGVRMVVKSVSAQGPADSADVSISNGIVTSATRFTYRTRSSHLVMLIQMSREMWQFDNDGEMHFEKLLNRFLPTLFAQWTAVGATHAITIILFSRTYYDTSLETLVQLSEGGVSLFSAAHGGAEGGSAFHFGDRALCIDADGRLYEDFYFTLVEDLVVQPSMFTTASAGASSGAAPSGSGTNLSGTSSGATPVAGGGGNAASAPTMSAGSSGSLEWHRIIRMLKRAFSQFPTYANWGLTPLSAATGSEGNGGAGAWAPAGSGSRVSPAALQAPHASAPLQSVQGSPSLASQGNLLEALNLCLNLFERHRLDRDMYRMGQNVVIVSSGSGAFEVDAALAQITKQRVIDNGIGCDLLGASVALATGGNQVGVERDVASGITVAYTQPHWMHCSFFGHISHEFAAIPNTSVASANVNLGPQAAHFLPFAANNAGTSSTVALAAAGGGSSGAGSGTANGSSGTATGYGSAPGGKAGLAGAAGYSGGGGAPGGTGVGGLSGAGGGNAMGAVTSTQVATGLAASNLPQPQSKMNPLLSAWHAARSNLLAASVAAGSVMVSASASGAHAHVGSGMNLGPQLFAGGMRNAHAASQLPGSVSRASAGGGGGGTSAASALQYFPFPAALLFSMYGPRLTALGPTYPPALLETLRRSRRARVQVAAALPTAGAAELEHPGTLHEDASAEEAGVSSMGSDVNLVVASVRTGAGANARANSAAQFVAASGVPGVSITNADGTEFRITRASSSSQGQPISERQRSADVAQPSSTAVLLRRAHSATSRHTRRHEDDDMAIMHFAFPPSTTTASFPRTTSSRLMTPSGGAGVVGATSGGNLHADASGVASGMRMQRDAEEATVSTSQAAAASVGRAGAPPTATSTNSVGKASSIGRALTSGASARASQPVSSSVLATRGAAHFAAVAAMVQRGGSVGRAAGGTHHPLANRFNAADGVLTSGSAGSMPHPSAPSTASLTGGMSLWGLAGAQLSLTPHSFAVSAMRASDASLAALAAEPGLDAVEAVGSAGGGGGLSIGRSSMLSHRSLSRLAAASLQAQLAQAEAGGGGVAAAAPPAKPHAGSPELHVRTSNSAASMRTFSEHGSPLLQGAAPRAWRGASCPAAPRTAAHNLCRAVGWAGHDDFGYVVVEAALPGVAAHLMRRVPGNEALYPWSALMIRLSQRATEYSQAQHSAGADMRLAVSRQLVAPALTQEENFRRKLYSKYQAHDAGVFSRRGVRRFAASPSLTTLQSALPKTASVAALMTTLGRTAGVGAATHSFGNSSSQLHLYEANQLSVGMDLSGSSDWGSPLVPSAASPPPSTRARRAALPSKWMQGTPVPAPRQADDAAASAKLGAASTGASSAELPLPATSVTSAAASGLPGSAHVATPGTPAFMAMARNRYARAQVWLRDEMSLIFLPPVQHFERQAIVAFTHVQPFSAPFTYVLPADSAADTNVLIADLSTLHVQPPQDVSSTLPGGALPSRLASATSNSSLSKAGAALLRREQAGITAPASNLLTAPSLTKMSASSSTPLAISLTSVQVLALVANSPLLRLGLENRPNADVLSILAMVLYLSLPTSQMASLASTIAPYVAALAGTRWRRQAIAPARTSLGNVNASHLRRGVTSEAPAPSRSLQMAAKPPAAASSVGAMPVPLPLAPASASARLSTVAPVGRPSIAAESAYIPSVAEGADEGGAALTLSGGSRTAFATLTTGNRAKLKPASGASDAPASHAALSAGPDASTAAAAAAAVAAAAQDTFDFIDINSTASPTSSYAMPSSMHTAQHFAQQSVPSTSVALVAAPPASDATPPVASNSVAEDGGVETTRRTVTFDAHASLPISIATPQASPTSVASTSTSVDATPAATLLVSRSESSSEPPALMRASSALGAADLPIPPPVMTDANGVTMHTGSLPSSGLHYLSNPQLSSSARVAAGSSAAVLSTASRADSADSMRASDTIERLVQQHAVDIASVLLGVKLSAHKAFAEDGHVLSAGSIVNPFRRLKRDLVLDTANRMRWWHMKPVEGMAEQQFTTPAVNSAGLVSVRAARPQPASRTHWSDATARTSMRASRTELLAASAERVPRLCLPMQSEEDGDSLETLLHSFSPNWKSLCEPAVLPLTTDYCPTQAELNSQYAVSEHSFDLSKIVPHHAGACIDVGAYTSMFSAASDAHGVQHGGNVGGGNTGGGAEAGGSHATAAAGMAGAQARAAALASMVEEMVCQRLINDFQLVLPAASGGRGAGSATPALPATVDGSGSGVTGGSLEAGTNVRVYHLSMGHIIHVISYDTLRRQVRVQMYNRKHVALPSTSGASLLSTARAAAPSHAGAGGSLASERAAAGSVRYGSGMSAALAGAAARAADEAGAGVGATGASPALDALATGSKSVARTAVAAPRTTRSTQAAQSVQGADAQMDMTSVARTFGAIIASQLSSAATSSSTAILTAKSLAKLARQLPSGHLDSSGTYQYRCMMWCPYRGTSVMTARAFVMPSATAVKSNVPAMAALVSSFAGACEQALHGVRDPSGVHSGAPRSAAYMTPTTKSFTAPSPILSAAALGRASGAPGTRGNPDADAAKYMGRSMRTSKLHTPLVAWSVGHAAPLPVAVEGAVKADLQCNWSVVDMLLLGEHNSISADTRNRQINFLLVPVAHAASQASGAASKHKPPAVRRQSSVSNAGGGVGVLTSPTNAAASLPSGDAQAAVQSPSLAELLSRCHAFEKFWASLRPHNAHNALPSLSELMSRVSVHVPHSDWLASRNADSAPSTHAHAPVGGGSSGSGSNSNSNGGAPMPPTPASAGVSSATLALAAPDAAAAPTLFVGAQGDGSIPPPPLITSASPSAASVGTEGAQSSVGRSGLTGRGGGFPSHSSGNGGTPLRNAGVLQHVNVVPDDCSSTLGTMRLDLQVHGAPIRDWVHLQHGSVYNPLRAFPITIQWVAATSHVVEALVVMLQRRARQHGFMLMSVSEYSRRGLHRMSGNGTAVAGSAAPALGAASSLHGGGGGAGGGSTSSSHASFDAQSMPPFLLPVPLALSHDVIAQVMGAAATTAVTSFGALELPASAILPRSASDADGTARATSAVSGDEGTMPPCERANSMSMGAHALATSAVASMSPLTVASTMRGLSFSAYGSPALAAQPVVCDGSLLRGLPAVRLPLLHALEHALVHVFGFMPDFANPGVAPVHRASVQEASMPPPLYLQTPVLGASEPPGSSSVPPPLASHAVPYALSPALHGMAARASVSGSFAGDDGLERDRSASMVSVSSSVAIHNAASAMGGRSREGVAHTVLHASTVHPSWFRQYVHLSGIAFVRIHAGGVHWIPNRIQLNKHSAPALAALAPWVSRARAAVASPRHYLGEEADDTMLGKVELFHALQEWCVHTISTGGGVPGTSHLPSACVPNV